ncbi:hypothetical protein NP493_664g02129 [Ridgeia piscesae]|uniref:Uncharacterized protein n=1 Tax=Ridgeia piscesae TaxID=27915 RepID=A0AAD9KS01_RIDPI|nr:hypothetical protein NP493_664g02129 [Ridgeia piscesae]
MSTWSTSPSAVKSWKEETHSRRRVMAARSRKYFCSMPSATPPPETEKS